jgi:hypothetical protein
VWFPWFQYPDAQNRQFSVPLLVLNLHLNI